MDENSKATLAGAILAAATAIQPMVAAIDGTFGTKEIAMLVLAGAIAALGYICKVK